MTDIQKRIAKKLLAVRANPSLEGCRALAIATEYCYFNPSAMSKITQEIYPEVAEVMHKTLSQIERNIRHTIDRIYACCDCETLILEGFAPNRNKDKLTNGEFIAILVENLRLEETEANPTC